MSEKPVIVVGGPTASGKSSLALDIAERFDGVVVNADSMQVYSDLSILTARPDAGAEARAPHILYGTFGLDQRCSAGTWRTLALDAIARSHADGKIPVVAGGTGLYLRALMTGLHRMPAVPGQIRDRLNVRLESEGSEVLHRDLAAVDRQSADRLNPNDGQRIVRALEVFEHTGQTLSSWQTGDAEDRPPGIRFVTVVLDPPRDTLYADIDARFDRMVEMGAVAEAEALLALRPAPDFPLLKAVGMRPIRAYLAGETDRDRMLELGKRDTRRYAKRQGTWFRHQIIPEMSLKTKYSEIDIPEFFSKISNFLLTD